jgi:predicted RNA-binding Zn ribbon-like protein
MQFDHHNLTGVRLAVALVNLTEPWEAAVLDEMLHEHWVRRVDLSEPACEGMRRLAQRLRLVFEATTLEARCEAVNVLLAGRAAPFLTLHDDLPPHLHFASTEDELVHRVTAFTAGSLAMFTVEAEGRRLGVCARGGCAVVFVDTSLNGRRSYCSARCANSDAVGRHRQRRRAGSSV